MSKKLSKSTERKKQPVQAEEISAKSCRILQLPERSFAPTVTPKRARLILLSDNKWANGTVLHYYFYRRPSRWTGSDAHLATVRQAFQNWKDVGIGLDFKEVNSPDEAEIRISFQSRIGHWSYIGRDILEFGPDEPTMNLDKSDNWGIDTAMHEIGHTLGILHEHQSAIAGIEWNEEAVYSRFSQPPNSWSRQDIFDNIIAKVDVDHVQGSSWDPDSIMHYSFEAGLIRNPAPYQNGLRPAPGLSEKDKQWVREFYPPLKQADYKTLQPFQSVQLKLEPSEQKNYVVQPTATRDYNFQTFGRSDTVLVLFEDVAGDLRYRTADDDSGVERNAYFQAKLYAGRKYILRVRLYYQHRYGDFGVMMW